VQTIGNTDAGFASYEDRQDIIDEQLVDNFNNFIYFGTITRSMVSLFGIVLLSEWSLIRPIAEVHPAMIPFFVIVVVLVTFGVLNVIIGIVVEKTTSAVQKFQQERVQARKKEQASIAEQLCELAFEIDTDGDARICIEELRASFENEKLRDLFFKLDLPLGFEEVEFLYMLDVDGNGSLSKQEFVHGILRLIFCSDFQRDCLHNMSIGALHHSLHKAFNDLREELRKGIAEISQEVRALRGLGPQLSNTCVRGFAIDDVDNKSENQTADTFKQGIMSSSDYIQMFTAILHKQSLGFVPEDASTITSANTSLPITPPIIASLPITPRRAEVAERECCVQASPAPQEFLTTEAHIRASMRTTSNISGREDRDASFFPSQQSVSEVREVSTKQGGDIGNKFQPRRRHADIPKQAIEENPTCEKKQGESARTNYRV